MNDELKVALKGSIDNFDIPAFDFAAVHERSLRSGKRAASRKPAKLLLVLCLALPAFGITAVKLWPAHFQYLSNGSVRVQAGDRIRLFQVRSSTAASAGKLLETIASTVPYRVLWPSPMPRRSKLDAVAQIGSQGILLTYSCGSARDRNFMDFVILPANASQSRVPLNRPSMSFGRFGEKWPYRIYTWLAGSERVIASGRCFSRARAALMRSEMVTAGAKRAKP